MRVCVHIENHRGKISNRLQLIESLWVQHRTHIRTRRLSIGYGNRLRLYTFRLYHHFENGIVNCICDETHTLSQYKLALLTLCLCVCGAFVYFKFFSRLSFCLFRLFHLKVSKMVVVVVIVLTIFFFILFICIFSHRVCGACACL